MSVGVVDLLDVIDIAPVNTLLVSTSAKPRRNWQQKGTI